MNKVSQIVQLLNTAKIPVKDVDLPVSMIFLGGSEREFFFRIDDLVSDGTVIQSDTDPEEAYEEYQFDGIMFRYFEEEHYICIKQV